MFKSTKEFHKRTRLFILFIFKEKKTNDSKSSTAAAASVTTLINRQVSFKTPSSPQQIVLWIKKVDKSVGLGIW